MKNSNVKIYLENDTEAPRYESDGASGFDLRAKFNPNIPFLTLTDIRDIITKPFSEGIEKLYNSVYKDYERNIIDQIHFYHVIVNVLKKKYKNSINNEVDLYGYMIDNNIDKVNIIFPYKSVIFPTDLYMEIPEEDELQIRPRSGISSKTLLQVSLGTVDSDYRGNIGIIIQNPSPLAYAIFPNERLAQGVIVSKKHAVFIEMDSKEDFSKTYRGEKGMGSTGTK